MNLYTQLIDRESKRHRANLESIHLKLPTILRAEKLARRLTERGVNAKASACQQGYIFLQVEVPIDMLAGGEYLSTTVSQSIGRPIIKNGESYLILPHDDEEGVTSLQLVVEGI